MRSESIIKIILFIFSVCFSGLLAQAQTFHIHNGDTINRTDAKGLKQGVWEKFYSNDVLYARTKFRNGQPVDTAMYYYASGKMKAMLIYKAKSNQKYSVMFSESGKKLGTGYYLGIEKDSLWNYYDEQGGISMTEFYRKGIPNGTWKVYFPGGKETQVTQWKEGKKEGTQTDFFETGVIQKQMTFKADIANGPFLFNFSNGKTWIRGTYKNGDKEGSWLYYNENGTVEKQEDYKKGVLQNPPEPSEK